MGKDRRRWHQIAKKSQPSSLSEGDAHASRYDGYLCTLNWNDAKDNVDKLQAMGIALGKN